MSSTQDGARARRSVGAAESRASASASEPRASASTKDKTRVSVPTSKNVTRAANMPERAGTAPSWRVDGPESSEPRVFTNDDIADAADDAEKTLEEPTYTALAVREQRGEEAAEAQRRQRLQPPPVEAVPRHKAAAAGAHAGHPPAHGGTKSAAHTKKAAAAQAAECSLSSLKPAFTTAPATVTETSALRAASEGKDDAVPLPLGDTPSKLSEHRASKSKRRASQLSRATRSSASGASGKDSSESSSFSSDVEESPPDLVLSPATQLPAKNPQEPIKASPEPIRAAPKPAPAAHEPAQAGPDRAHTAPVHKHPPVDADRKKAPAQPPAAVEERKKSVKAVPTTSPTGTSKKPAAHKTVERIVEAAKRARDVHAERMAEATASVTALLQRSGIARSVVPVVPLEGSSACDFCVLLSGQETMERYLVPIVRALCGAGMKVIYGRPTTVHDEATGDDHVRQKKTFRNMYCYTVEVVPVAVKDQQVSNVSVSLHVSVAPDMDEIYYAHYVEYFNGIGKGGEGLDGATAVDLPFPPKASSLTDAQRKRILFLALSELVNDTVAVSPDGDAGISLFPAHVDAIRDKIWSDCIGSSPWKMLWKPLMRADETAIAAYFGEETMFYFAWMNHYQRWLALASVVTVGMHCLGYTFRITAPADTAAAAAAAAGAAGPTLEECYSLLTLVALTILGSVLCIKMWERRCSTLCARDHLFQPKIFGRGEPRHEYKGKMGVNPITGKPERQYPAWRRAFLLQPFAWLVVFLFVGLTLLVMVAFVNLEGLTAVDPQTGEYGLAVIPWLRWFSLSGRVFDSARHPWLALLPTVLYSACISGLSVAFETLAEKLTKLENYHYRGDHVRALTQKRVVFEFVNSFAKLLFLAIVRHDITSLSTSLKTIFFTSVFSRLLFDTVIPFLSTHRHRVARSMESRQAAANGAAPPVAQTEGHGGSTDSALDEVDERLDTYEVYSDYVEMIIQFGYIVLFAVAFPMAPLVALVSNIIEVRSDLFKLCYIVRRPIPRLGVEENGTWIGVLRHAALAAVVTNLALFAVGAKPMIAQVFSSYFTSESVATSVMASDGTVKLMNVETPVLNGNKGREIFLLGVMLEHLLIGVAVFLFWRISPRPKAVRLYVEKKQYEQLGGAKEKTD